MKRTRADIRLTDLQNGADEAKAKLMNVNIPTDVSEAIDRIATNLGCTKTETVIALLNEGLDSLEERRGEFGSSTSNRAVGRHSRRSRHS